MTTEFRSDLIQNTISGTQTTEMIDLETDVNRPMKSQKTNDSQSPRMRSVSPVNVRTRNRDITEISDSQTSSPPGSRVSKSDKKDESWLFVHCTRCLTNYPKANDLGGTCISCPGSTLMAGRAPAIQIPDDEPQPPDRPAGWAIQGGPPGPSTAWGPPGTPTGGARGSGPVEYYAMSPRTEDFVSAERQAQDPPTSDQVLGSPKAAQTDYGGISPIAEQSLGSPQAAQAGAGTSPTPFTPVVAVGSPQAVPVSPDTSGEQTANSKESEYTLRRGRPDDPRGQEMQRARSYQLTGRSSVDSFRSAGSAKSCKMCGGPGAPGKVAVKCLSCHRHMCLQCSDRCPDMDEGCNLSELCPTCRPPRSHRCQGMVMKALRAEKDMKIEMTKRDADMRVKEAEMQLKMMEDRMAFEKELKDKQIRELNVQGDEARVQLELNAKAFAEQQRAAEQSEQNLKNLATQHLMKKEQDLEQERAARNDAEQRGRAQADAIDQTRAAAEERVRSTSTQASRLVQQHLAEVAALKKTLADRDRQHADDRQNYMNTAAQDYQDQLERQKRENEKIVEDVRKRERERMQHLIAARKTEDHPTKEQQPSQPVSLHEESESVRRCYICPDPAVTDCHSCKRGICNAHHNAMSQRCPRCEERRSMLIMRQQLKAEQKRIHEKLLALPGGRRDDQSGPTPGGSSSTGPVPPPPRFGTEAETADAKAIVDAKRAKRTKTGGPSGGGDGDDDPEDDDGAWEEGGYDDPDAWHDAQSIDDDDMRAIMEASEEDEKEDASKKKPPRKPGDGDDGDPPPGGGGPGPPRPPGGGGPGGDGTPPSGGPNGGPNPPGGPQGAPGGGGGGGGGDGGGGDGGGGDGDNSGLISGAANRDLLIINSTQAEANLKIQDFPTVVGREDWQKILARTVAQASRHHNDAFLWIMVAIMIGPGSCPDEDLKDTGDERFRRLDMKIGALILEKAQGIRSRRNHKDTNIIELSDRICQLEHDAHNEPRLMTGREMVRVIVKFQSVQESWQQYFQFSDLLETKFTYTGDKANKEIGGWLAKWNASYQRVDGIHEHRFQLLALEHFYRQIKKVPCIDHIINKFYFCTDEPGTGERTYEWLKTNITDLLNKKRLEQNREDQKKGLLRQLNNNERWGGPAVPGEKGDGKGPRDTRLIPCRHHAKPGGCIKGNNCEYLHSGPSGTKGKKGDGKGKKGAGKGKKGGKAGAPAEQVTPSAAPATEKMPCYAYSRNDCKDPNCLNKRVHRKLTNEEKERRNAWEKRMISEGKTLPYTIPGGAPAADPKAKAKAKAKPKPRAGSVKPLCKFIKQGKICPQGDSCQWPHQ